MQLAAIFDLLLAAMLLTLGLGCLVARNIFLSVVQFIALSLLMALAWTRLAAPDLALAEAAIGAGLTGALLLATVRRMSDEPRPKTSAPADEGRT